MLTKNSNSDYKYYAKLKEGKKFRYFYTKAEYDAYLNGKKSQTDSVNSSKVDVKGTFADLKNRLKAAYNKYIPDPIKKGISTLVDKGKEFLNKFLHKSADDVNPKDVDKGKKYADQFRHMTTDEFLKNNKKGFENLKETDTPSTLIKQAINNVSKDPQAYRKDLKAYTGFSVYKELYYDPNTFTYLAFDQDDKLNASTIDLSNSMMTPFMKLNDDGTLKIEKDWVEVADTSFMNQRTDSERKAEMDSYARNEQSFMKTLPRVTEIESYDDVMDNINERLLSKAGYQNNCLFASATYEMRCRGYDVDVNPWDKIENTADESGLSSKRYFKSVNNEVICTINPMETIYENPKTEMIYNYMPKRLFSDSKDAKDIIEKIYPPNTRGDLSVAWVNGGQHSMIFEIDKNGDMIVRDCQTHHAYTGSEIYDLLSYCDPKSIGTTRTDNLNFKKGVLYAVTKN